MYEGWFGCMVFASPIVLVDTGSMSLVQSLSNHSPRICILLHFICNMNKFMSWYAGPRRDIVSTLPTEHVDPNRNHVTSYY